MKKILEDKRNVVLLVMGILCILAVIVGITYAYIAYYTRQKEVNVLGTDCIKIEYKDKTNAISLTNARPMTDEEGANTIPYIFEITNVCNVGVNYNVNLEILTQKEGQPIDNLLESKNVATKIDNIEVKRLASEIATTPTYDEADYKATEAYTMYTGVLNPHETKSHEVRLWLHESAGNETQNKYFYSKVVIEAIQNEIAEKNFSEYIMNKNDTSIVQIVHEATEQTPSLTDYRYTGSNPNNYVYFGCEENCTEDNLYRIIGVIPTQSTDTGSYQNRVKLIKANYYTEETSGLLLASEGTYPPGGGSGKGYQWNSSANNQWQASTLQSRVLNGVYWNNLGEYQNFISPAVWYLGAPTYSSYETYTPDQFYNEERSNTQGKSGGATSYIPVKHTVRV